MGSFVLSGFFTKPAGLPGASESKFIGCAHLHSSLKALAGKKQLMELWTWHDHASVVRYYCGKKSRPFKSLAAAKMVDLQKIGACRIWWRGGAR